MNRVELNGNMSPKDFFEDECIEAFFGKGLAQAILKLSGKQ